MYQTRARPAHHGPHALAAVYWPGRLRAKSASGAGSGRRAARRRAASAACAQPFPVLHGQHGFVKTAVGGGQTPQWRLLLSKGIRTAVLVGTAIAILGQFMGVNAVLYYGPSIFERAGWSGSDSLFAQILVGAVNMLTTVLALAIIDRVGRKRLVYWGVSGMVLSLLLIGTCFLTGERSGMPDGVLLAAFLCYIFCCAISVCAVVWVLLSEMYPIRVRGAAMSIAGFALWVGTYLVGQLTPWMLANLTPAGTFFLFAAMCVPYMLLIWKAVPETSGRTLEEIERYWTR